MFGHAHAKGVIHLARCMTLQSASAPYCKHRPTLSFHLTSACLLPHACRVYDAAKRLITGSEDADDETFTVQLLAGGMAGGAAAGEGCLVQDMSFAGWSSIKLLPLRLSI
eukprot:1161687-Pelagomonas_calceolata.AAC.7